MGDLRGDCDAARRAVLLARSSVVVAVLRIPRAAGAFMRLIDMGVPAAEVAQVSLGAFSTRLFRPANGDARQEFRLLHEQIVVTDPIRSLIIAGADDDAIHRRAISEGMCSLRQAGLEQVRAGNLAPDAVATMTPDDCRRSGPCRAGPLPSSSPGSETPSTARTEAPRRAAHASSSNAAEGHERSVRALDERWPWPGLLALRSPRAQDLRRQASSRAGLTRTLNARGEVCRLATHVDDDLAALLEQLAQLRATALHTRLHARDRDADHLGRFFRGPAF